jgi:OOP family OmpA-OmpF porin
MNQEKKKEGNGMKSVVGRVALLLVIACAILAVSEMTAHSSDKVVEEIKAAYAENVEVTVIPKIDNFIVVFDESGSMYLTDQGARPSKAKVGKDIMAALNERIPELGFQGAVVVFAPSRVLIGPTAYSRESFGQTIEGLPETGIIFGNRTPLGDAIMQRDPDLSISAGKTAVLIVSDGERNIGMDALEAAIKLHQKYPNVCFHTISLADNEKGKTTLKAISKLGDDCVYAEASELTGNPNTIDQLAKDIFYTVETREIVQEVVEVEAAAVVPEIIEFDTPTFAFDQYELTPEAKMGLDENLEALSSQPDLSIVIQGHTDSIGPEDYNQKLSEKRAQAVYEYLNSKGVSPERMQTMGYGESRPVADNSSAQGRAMNRRTEISAAP